MARIKWAGIVKDVSEYQQGELPPNAKKLDMPSTMGEMMIKALPFLIPSIAVIILSMFLKTYFYGAPVISFPYLLLGLVTGFLLSLVHELLHAVVYPRGATVYIGIAPKSFAAVALASYPLSKGRFALMSLLPTVLGIIPIAAFWAMPPSFKAVNGFLFGAAVFGLASPYPDFYNVFKVFRQAPKKSRVMSYKNYTIAID